VREKRWKKELAWIMEMVPSRVESGEVAEKMSPARKRDCRVALSRKRE